MKKNEPDLPMYRNVKKSGRHSEKTAKQYVHYLIFLKIHKNIYMYV